MPAVPVLAAAVACASCGKVRPRAGSNAAGHDICEVCCRRHDPRRRRICGRCGKTAPVAVRGQDGRPDICVNCYQMPAATCSICGRHRQCHFAADRPAGLHVVLTAGGGRPAPAAARTARRQPAGPRGRSATRATPPRCATGAGAHPAASSAGWSPRPARPPTPARTAPGIPVTHACTDCGTEDKLYEKGRCARCSLRRRARELLSAGTGTIAAELAGVFDAITAARQPRSALNWLRKGAGAGLLADVAAGRLAISHQALDDCPHRRAADYLRHMLTAAGTLPPATRNSPAPGNGSARSWRRSARPPTGGWCRPTPPGR